MSEVTRLLDAAAAGDRKAAADLLPLVYDELRRLAAARMAAETPGHTLDATALVHEAYLRLVGPTDDGRWDGRGHFFAAAAEAMRRILVESGPAEAGGEARRRDGPGRPGGGRRGRRTRRAGRPPRGARRRPHPAGRREEPEVAQVVNLRYFAGLTIEQAAAALGVSVRTANRHWAFAKAWLYRELGPGG